MSTQHATDKAEVERALDRVFARPEFGDREETLLEKMFEWLGEFFDVDPDPTDAIDAAGTFINVVLVLVALALVTLIGRVLFQRYRLAAERRRQAAAEIDSHRERIRELFRASRAARADGDLRLALRLALFALVAGLGERGAIEYRDTWTYREILRHGDPGTSAATLLSGLVAELESKDFGNAPIEAGDVDRLEELCRTHLRTALEGEAA